MPFSQHHPSSFKPHVALMLIGFVTMVVLSFVLFIGWRWYFGEINKRQELARISRKADEGIAERAAVRAETARKTVLGAIETKKASASEPAKSSVSLVEMAHVNEGGVFPDPVPISEEVTAERQADAQGIQQRFWQATTWREKLPFVHDAERVMPLMRDYYEKHQMLDPIMSGSARQAHFKINNTEVLLYSYSSVRPSGTLDVAMIAQPNGKFLIDWESMVGASDLPWLEFKKTRPTQPFLVRVFARPDDYFNYEFSDDKRWSAAHLTSPDGNFFIYGYCEKDSEVARTLASIFEQVRGRAALTLRIAYPEKAESDHCARIVGIVANRWLLVR